MLYTQYLVKQGEKTFRQLQDEQTILEQKIETSKKIVKSLISQKEKTSSFSKALAQHTKKQSN